MNRIFKYYKNCKGITLVLMAFMLAVLLMLAGLAIDIAYMYYVKNQLQVAADAAALAGAARLDGKVDNVLLNPNVLEQLEARQEAWKFACKNSAAGQNVYLVNGEITDGDGKVIGLRSCADADMPDNLNNGNSTNGDIVVGYWSTTPPSSVTCEPAGSGYFCPATGSTGLAINAIKTRPRRSGTIENPDTPGMPQVRVFIGQIFRIINADWTFMSARASAIAATKPPTFGPMPICIDTCLNLPQTPLTGTPPGILLQVQQPGPAGPETMAWTDFQQVPGDPSYRGKLGEPGIYDLLGVDKVQGKWQVIEPQTPPNQCNTVTCLRTKQGGGDVLPAITAIIQPQARGAVYMVKGIPIFGWKTAIPVFTPCSPSGPSPCPGDQPHGYRWIEATKVIVTGVIESGNTPGIYVVGLEESNTNPGFSRLSCVPCDSPTLVDMSKVRLVK